MPAVSCSAKRPVGLVAIAIAFLACCLLVAAGANPSRAAASDAATSLLKPAKTLRHGRSVVFKAHRLAADRLGRATFRYRGRRKRLSAPSVRRALQHKHSFTTRVPSRWLPTAAAGARKAGALRHKRERYAGEARLLVSLKSRTGTGGQGTSGQLRVGLVSNAQGWDMNSGAVLDKIAPTGAQWIREEFDWDVIEPTNDVWNWQRYDHLLIEAAARNIRILPVLINTPSWAGSSWNQIPSNPSEYAEYTAKVVARYGPGGSFWRSRPKIASFAPDYFELWNEPYLSFFSADGVNPGRYAKLVKAATATGRAANPKAKFLLEADQTPGGDARHTFIDDMYAAVPDLNSYFDAVAVHPYSGSSAPDDPRGGWGFPRIADVRDKFVSHGAKDKPLWITEVGWSTCPSNPDYCTSEQDQAAYLSQMFDLLQSKYSSYVRAAFIYRREDLGSDPSDKEGWFGLERLDGSHKPAYDVFRSVTGA
jgi:hypothetical protein